MESERYRVVEGSESAHCCFEWTVVDTEKPFHITGIGFENRFEQVCESFSMENAVMICDALNYQFRKQKESEK